MASGKPGSKAARRRTLLAAELRLGSVMADISCGQAG